MARETAEFSIGPVGPFFKTSRVFAGARAAAKREGVRCHLYVIREGRRLFVGYAHTDGSVTDVEGRKIYQTKGGEHG